MPLKFKPLQENDLVLIKEIYDWYIDNSTATFHTQPIQITELKEFIYIQHPLYPSFLIYQNETRAGYCYLTHFKKRQAYNRTVEITIYLKPEFYKQGIGKAAIAYLESIAMENGIKTLIGGITGDNYGSIALFESCGFSKCAHYKNVGEKFGQVLDVVVYQKEI